MDRKRRIVLLKVGVWAAVWGMRDYSAVSFAIRRFDKRLKRNKADRKLLKRLRQMLNVEM